MGRVQRKAAQGRVDQLEDRFVRNEEAASSNLATSTSVMHTMTAQWPCSHGLHVSARFQTVLSSSDFENRLMKSHTICTVSTLVGLSTSLLVYGTWWA